MSSTRWMSVARPAQYAASGRPMSSSASASANDWTAEPGTSRPRRRSSRAKATGVSASAGTGRLDQLVDAERAEALRVLAVLDDRAQRGVDGRVVELGPPERRQRADPVDGLGDAGRLVQAQLPHALDCRGDLRGQCTGGLRDLELDDRDLALERRVLDPVVEASALQRVVHVPGAVRGDDDERR